jgi:hypothetical protein
MKAYRGSRHVAPLVLNLGIRWSRVVNFMPQLLYHRKRTLIHIEYETGWTREPFQMFWIREKYSCILSAFKALTCQPVAQLMYHGFMALLEAKLDTTVLFLQIGPSGNHRSHHAQK